MEFVKPEIVLLIDRCNLVSQFSVFILVTAGTSSLGDLTDACIGSLFFNIHVFVTLS